MSVIVRCDGCGKEWHGLRKRFAIWEVVGDPEWELDFDPREFDFDLTAKHACSEECKQKIMESEKE